MADIHIATLGCCPGCQYCYGMAINCHRKKCRCGNLDQCPVCNMTQPDDGHRDGCSIGEAEDEATEHLAAMIARAPGSPGSQTPAPPRMNGSTAIAPGNVAGSTPLNQEDTHA